MSPGHNANKLNKGYSVIGIARSHNSDGALGWYKTTDICSKLEISANDK